MSQWITVNQESSSSGWAERPCRIRITEIAAIRTLNGGYSHRGDAQAVVVLVSGEKIHTTDTFSEINRAIDAATAAEEAVRVAEMRGEPC